MKKILLSTVMAGMIAGSLSGANFDIGISGSDRGISGFSLSVGNYYRIPHQELVIVERTVPGEELSVVYFLAHHSHRDVRYITDMRSRGISWWDITLRLGLDPYSVFVIDSDRYASPPYGKAYGYHNGGKHHRLRDVEIVDLVNVRFLSSYYGIPTDEVIERRRGGEHFYRIDDYYRNKKIKVHPEHFDDHGFRNDHGKDRGNDQGRGHDR